MNPLSRSILFVLVAFPLASCASVPAPATKAPNNPASATAAEGPIQKLELFALPDAPISPAVETAPSGMAMPGMDHSKMNQDTYTCVMHPQIAEAKPGKCPSCGMPLVKKPAGKK